MLARGRRSALRRLAAVGLAAALFAALATSTAAAGTMVLQRDGRILLAGVGNEEGGILFRFLPNGERDSSFGEGGLVADDRFNPFIALAVQDDGKILAGAGQPTTTREGERFALARYLADGGPDLFFGRAGAVKGGSGFAPQAILPRADGGFAVAANAPGPNLSYSSEHGFVRLYGPDGSVSGPLGAVPPVEGEAEGEGEAELQQTWIHDLLAGPGDSMIGVGHVHSEGGYIVRFVPDRPQSYDPSFGSDGGLVSLPQGDSIFDAAWDGEKILVAGIRVQTMFLARFESDGKPDLGFGDGGLVVQALPGTSISSANSVAVQGDGRIVVAASRWPKGAFRLRRPCAPCRQAILVRFESDGDLDTSFGEAGVAGVARPNGRPLFAMGDEVALTPGGRILMAATAEHTDRPTNVLARFTAGGRLDPSFGDRGVALTEPCPVGDAPGPWSRCVPLPRVRLSFRRASNGSLRIRGLVSPNYGWARMEQVQLKLPRPLRFRRAFVEGVGKCGRLCGYGGGSNSPGHVEASSRSLAFGELEDPRLSFVLSGQALQIPPGLRAGRKLAFQLKVQFGETEPWRSVTVKRAVPG